MRRNGNRSTTKTAEGHKEVEETAEKIVADMKRARSAMRRTAVSAVAKDKLGATSRLAKRKDLTLDDYRAYWDGAADGRRKAGG